MLLFGALAFTARVQSGCSSATTPISPAADAEVPLDSAPPRDAGTKDAKVPPTPGELEGWVTWNDYDPKCGFQVPSERKYLPEPFEWEPCQDTEVTRKLVCRRIKKKWEGFRGEFIAPDTKMFTREDGSLMMATLQYLGHNAIYLISEVDGPMKVAVHGSLDRECLISGHSGNGSRYVFQLSERDSQGKWAQQPAGIGGHVDELVPKKLLRKPYAIAHTLEAGNAGLVDSSRGRLEVYSWTDPPTLVRTIQGGGSYSFVKMHDDFFFWASDAPAATERIWTPEGGDQLLVGVASDVSRGAADLNTDGKDWVWGEGEGRTNAGYPIVKIVTAPFTRDPSKLQKRILRNDLGNGAFAANPFAVGHGYAAHVSSKNDALGAMVVRLSDGSAWSLPGRPGPLPHFQDPLAITKDEVFFLVRDENGTNVYRVRLDSLGAFALPPAPN